MNSIIERTGWTLIHSLWEGGLIWIAFQAAMVALRRRSAGLRCLMGCAALVLVGVVPLLTFLRLEETVGSLPVHLGGAAAVLAPQPGFREVIAGGAVRLYLSFCDDLKRILPWLVLIWGIGFALGAVRLLVDLGGTLRLAKSAKPVSEQLRRRCCRLALRLGIKQAVRIGEIEFWWLCRPWWGGSDLSFLSRLPRSSGVRRTKWTRSWPTNWLPFCRKIFQSMSFSRYAP